MGSLSHIDRIGFTDHTYIKTSKASKKAIIDAFHYPSDPEHFIKTRFKKHVVITIADTILSRKRPNRDFFHRTEPNRIWKNFLPNRTEPNRISVTEPNRTTQNFSYLNTSLKIHRKRRSRCWESFSNFVKKVWKFQSQFCQKFSKLIFLKNFYVNFSVRIVIRIGNAKREWWC